MAINYTPTEWLNDVTPVNQQNLTNIEQGITNCVNAINALLEGSGTQIAISYTNDVLEIVLKNADGDVLDTKTVTIPTKESLINASMSDSDLVLTKNNGQSITIQLGSIFYTQTYINSCFTEVNIEED